MVVALLVWLTVLGVLFTVLAAIADLLGRLFPEWDPGAQPSAENGGKPREERTRFDSP